MKLYTEEQMIEFINFYNSANPREYGGYLHPTMGGSERSHNNQTTKNILNAYTNTITQIKLPSDEEIEHESEVTWSLLTYQDTFKRGAKWMRDKILNK